MKQLEINKKLPDIELTNENINVFTFVIPEVLNMMTYTIGYICDTISDKNEKILFVRRIMMININNINKIKDRIDKEFY